MFFLDGCQHIRLGFLLSLFFPLFSFEVLTDVFVAPLLRTGDWTASNS